MRAPYRRRCFLLAAFTTLVLSGCWSGTITVLSGQDSSSSPSVPTVAVLEGVGAQYVAVFDMREGVPSDQPVRVRFSQPMLASSVLAHVRLLRPVDGLDITSPAALPPMTAVDGQFALTDVGANIWSFQTPDGVLHTGRWHRLELDAGIVAENGMATSSAHAVNFKVGDGVFGLPQVIDFGAAPAQAASLPNGGGFVMIEISSGNQLFGVRSLADGTLAIPELVSNRRLDATFLSLGFSGVYRQTQPAFNLTSSDLGRLIYVNYEPKGSVFDDITKPLSIAAHVFDVDAWSSVPERNNLSSLEPIGLFDGTQNSFAGWTQQSATPSVVAQSWYPRTTFDAQGRALCAWLSIEDFENDPTFIENATISTPLSNVAILNVTDGSNFAVLRGVLQRTALFGRVNQLTESGGVWSAIQELSDPTLEYCSNPFVFADDGGGPAAVFWYQSSQPLPIQCGRNTLGQTQEGALDAAFDPTGVDNGSSFGGVWWPTASGVEDYFVSYVDAATGALGPRIAFGMDDNVPQDARELPRPIVVGRTRNAGQDVFVVLGIDARQSSPADTGTLVVQEFSLGGTIFDPVAVPTHTATNEQVFSKFKLSKSWRNRANGAGLSFERISETQFALIFEGGFVPDPAHPQMFSTIYDTETRTWTPLIAITEARDNYALLAIGGVPKDVCSREVVDPNGIQRSRFESIRVRRDRDGNLIVVLDQIFDLDGDGVVPTVTSTCPDNRPYEREMGFASMLRFDSGAYRSHPLDLRDAWSATPEPLLDPTDSSITFFLQRQPIVSETDSAGRVFVATILKDPNSPLPTFNLATAGLRLGATAAQISSAASPGP